MDSDAAPRVAVRVRDLGHVEIQRGVHGPLVQLRALADQPLAALLVEVEVRVRRLEPASIPSRHGRGSLTRRVEALRASSTAS